MKLYEHPDFEQAILRAAEHFGKRGLRPAFFLSLWSEAKEKTYPQADEGERERRWWESGVPADRSSSVECEAGAVGTPSDKHALSFGAQATLARTTGKGPLSGPSTGAARSGTRSRVAPPCPCF